MKGDYYNSIEDLPIWNWWKVSETGNLSYLRKDENYKGKAPNLKLWEKINDEYFNEYGINDNLKQLMRLKKEWIRLKEKYLVKGIRFALTELDIVEAKMKDLDKVGDFKKEDTIIYLEEKLGRELDTRKVTVKKYYNYLNYYRGK